MQPRKLGANKYLKSRYSFQKYLRGSSVTRQIPTETTSPQSDARSGIKWSLYLLSDGFSLDSIDKILCDCET
jgi:hypothetical protein